MRKRSIPLDFYAKHKDKVISDNLIDRIALIQGIKKVRMG